MNHTSQYRTALPHHLHHNQGPPLQSFSGRFPPTNLESVNAVMIPTIGHEDPVQYHTPIQPFHSDRHNDQQIKINEPRKSDRNFTLPNNDCERQENCQETYKPTTSTPNTENQFPQHCSQGSKNCIQCYKGQVHTNTNSRNKIMVDVATMTDAEEVEQTSNWQNVSVPPNTKVAEYLSSLRQFLKLSNPTEGKRKLGDVRIVTSPDGSRLYCCPECHMAYPDKTLLEPHLATHKIERRFVCGVCGAGLKRKEHLDRHQLSHSDERPYSCAACPKTFKRNEHLARHYVIHSGEKAQVCSECGKAFYRKDHLRKHTQGHLTKRLRMAAMAS